MNVCLWELMDGKSQDIRCMQLIIGVDEVLLGRLMSHAV